MKTDELAINRRVLALMIMSIIFGMLLEYSTINNLGMIFRIFLILFLVGIVAFAINLVKKIKEYICNISEKNG